MSVGIWSGNLFSESLVQRLIKLIPQNTTSNYSLDGGHNKVSTVYNHLMVLFTKASEEEGEE